MEYLSFHLTIFSFLFFGIRVVISLKQEQKSKPKRDREKNLLELSDEWKKK
jgi:cbb3-type cytochrome oxidase subunit 3